MRNSKATDKTNGFSRMVDILANRIPVSKSNWWQGIKDGRYPPGIKLSPRTTAWRNSDLDELEQLIGEGKDWCDHFEPKQAA